ncbi:MAG: 4-hydroxy-tetrahydrodipicolinate reductase [Firmicutes bacterium]|nr:4-hydroxy-tetrahydrodipicolinate reductase [Bacillota bacterium]
MLRVLVNGAAGKMGRSMSAGILAEEDMQLVAAVDQCCLGADLGELCGSGRCGVAVEADLAAAIEKSQPDVMLDFTVPAAVMDNLRVAQTHKLAAVVGTTGLTKENLEELRASCEKSGAPVFVASNFALGAVLLMRFAAEAARYLPEYEVLEIHNERKLDAPSGTALTTLNMMEAQRLEDSVGAANTRESVPGCRGGAYAGSHVHSLRLPGAVAIQEVIFGAPGQMLSLRHEATARDCFYPGVALALRKIKELKGLTLGLEHLL